MVNTTEHALTHTHIDVYVYIHVTYDRELTIKPRSPTGHHLYTCQNSSNQIIPPAASSQLSPPFIRMQTQQSWQRRQSASWKASRGLRRLTTSRSLMGVKASHSRQSQPSSKGYRDFNFWLFMYHVANYTLMYWLRMNRLADINIKKYLYIPIHNYKRMHSYLICAVDWISLPAYHRHSWRYNKSICCYLLDNHIQISIKYSVNKDHNDSLLQKRRSMSSNHITTASAMHVNIRPTWCSC